MIPTPMPTPTSGLIGALVFLGGALAAALVGAALTARQAREDLRGEGGNSTGDNGTRNETQRRPPQQPPPPSPPSIRREHPSGGLRDLEEGRVEGRGGENGGGGGAEERKNVMVLIVMLAMRTMVTVLQMFKIGSGITTLLELFLCFGIVVFFFFGICRISSFFHGFN